MESASKCIVNGCQHKVGKDDGYLINGHPTFRTNVNELANGFICKRCLNKLKTASCVDSIEIGVKG